MAVRAQPIHGVPVYPGTRGQKPLICIGINPSTARPGDLDPTLKSVERVAKANGFDSFIMFNVYAQRATSPDDMERTCNPELHRENMRAFAYALSLNPRPVVWAAWGTIIEKRDYLWPCLEDMIALGREYGARWVTCGRRSKAGHPHHPLYLRADAQAEPSTWRNTSGPSRPGRPPPCPAAPGGYEERPWEKAGLTSAPWT